MKVLESIQCLSSYVNPNVVFVFRCLTCFLLRTLTFTLDSLSAHPVTSGWAALLQHVSMTHRQEARELGVISMVCIVAGKGKGTVLLLHTYSTHILHRSWINRVLPDSTVNCQLLVRFYWNSLYVYNLPVNLQSSWWMWPPGFCWRRSRCICSRT